MASAWTLPLIRLELDNLPLGCDFILAADDAAALFGANDAASRLISIFAASHGCRAVFRLNELVFQKRLRSAAPKPQDTPGPPECFTPWGSCSDDYPSASCR